MTDMKDYALSKRAMLVSLSLPSVQSRRKDKEKSNEVADAAGAKRSKVSTVVTLLPDEYIAGVSAVGRRIKSEHERLSVPWDRKGTCLVSVDMLDTYNEVMQRYLPVYQSEVDALANNLPALKAAAKLNDLGQLFKEEAYESPEALKERLKIELNFYPVPTSGDFRVDLSQSSMDYLKSSLEDDIKEKLRRGMSTVVDRMSKVVEEFIDRIEKYHEAVEQGSDRKPTLKTSVLDNVTDLLKIVPCLNLTDDQEIKTFAARISSELIGYPIKDIRDIRMVRINLIKDAKVILAEMQQRSE